MCKRNYEYILYDCVLKSFRTEYVDEAAERRARAAGGGRAPGAAALALSAAHRRRRALYVGAAGGAGGAAGLQPPPAAAGRAERGASGRAAAAGGNGTIRRGADDPELQAFVKRELQAVLLQEDVALVMQHVLGVVRTVVGATASGSGVGAAGRGAAPGLALAPGRNKYVPQPKRLRATATAPGLAATIQEVEAALCREATCFLQADAPEFARQLGLFLTSGLSVKAYDELVFGSAEGHAPQDRQEGGPVDGALGSAAAEYAGAVGSSILERLASSREATQPQALNKENSSVDAFVKSEFIKDRQPTRGILRKADDASWEKLQSKFSSLEGEMLNFSTQTQVRRESLTRVGAPGALSQPTGPSAAPPPPVGLAGSVSLRGTAAANTLAAPWLASHRTQPTDGNAEQQQPPSLAQPTNSALPDSGGSQDDDGCTGSLISSKERFVTIPPGAAATSKIAKAAIDTFEEPGLQKLVDEGLHKQLQRTKDGATEKSRIHELAELVKLLRKCVKELGSRSSQYIDLCMKIERECAQQVESVKLSTKTSLKQLEAELASTRQSLAESERDYRNDKAQWGMDLETQRSETSRLLRELERLTEERDRARDEAKRNDQLRTQAEAELKERLKTSSQQVREATINQSEAMRALNEEKTQAENKITGLKDEVAKMSKTLKAQQDCVTEYEREVQLLRATVDNLRGSLAGKEAASGVQSEQITKLHKELSQTREQLAALTSEEQRLQQELASAGVDREELRAMLEQQGAELEQQRQRIVSLEQQADEDKADWEAKRQELEESVAALTAEGDQLRNTIEALRQAIQVTNHHKEEAEMLATREGAEKAALMRERTNLQHQLEFAESAQAQAEQATAAVRTELAAAQAELAGSRQAVEDKESRLAHLEGEFEALKEVLGETSALNGGDSKDIVATLLSKIATLQNAAVAAEAVRRKLHNELVDLRGNIRVYCRVRPHPSPSTRIAPDGSSIALQADGKDHAFAYDRVFGPDSSQESVFSAVSELVQSALDGFHVCIFSYGQTGAGKTHTMQGGESPTSRGIIPRAVEKILSQARKLEEQAEWSYSMEASFIEIYNNQLRDLLGGGSGGGAPYINDLHAIKHDPDGGHTIVAGVSKVPVTDAECAAQLVRRAAAARAVEATAMNSQSSRSHSVFMLYISGWHAGTATRLQGCLCLVDLAGSERLDRSLAEGQAKKEACAINQSLSALGDVFASLSSKSSHVPYRNTKLTYLLQPCLGGSGKTLMFVNVNPEPASAGESLCSLRFAAKVSGCETGARGGARRNVLTMGPAGGGAGGSGSAESFDPAASMRCSLSGLPRVPGAAGAVDAAAAKRMSLLPQRAAAGPGGGPDVRMSLAGLPRGVAGRSVLAALEPSRLSPSVQPSAPPAPPAPTVLLKIDAALLTPALAHAAVAALPLLQRLEVTGLTRNPWMEVDARTRSMCVHMAAGLVVLLGHHQQPAASAAAASASGCSSQHVPPPAGYAGMATRSRTRGAGAAASSTSAAAAHATAPADAPSDCRRKTSSSSAAGSAAGGSSCGGDSGAPGGRSSSVSTTTRPTGPRLPRLRALCIEHSPALLPHFMTAALAAALCSCTHLQRLEGLASLVPTTYYSALSPPRQPAAARALVLDTMAHMTQLRELRMPAGDLAPGTATCEALSRTLATGSLTRLEMPTPHTVSLQLLSPLTALRELQARYVARLTVGNSQTLEMMLWLRNWLHGGGGGGGGSAAAPGGGGGPSSALVPGGGGEQRSRDAYVIPAFPPTVPAKGGGAGPAAGVGAGGDGASSSPSNAAAGASSRRLALTSFGIVPREDCYTIELVERHTNKNRQCVALLPAAEGGLLAAVQAVRRIGVGPSSLAQSAGVGLGAAEMRQLDPAATEPPAPAAGAPAAGAAGPSGQSAAQLQQQLEPQAWSHGAWLPALVALRLRSLRMQGVRLSGADLRTIAHALGPTLQTLAVLESAFPIHALAELAGMPHLYVVSLSVDDWFPKRRELLIGANPAGSAAPPLPPPPNEDPDAAFRRLLLRGHPGVPPGAAGALYDLIDQDLRAVEEGRKRCRPVHVLLGLKGGTGEAMVRGLVEYVRGLLQDTGRYPLDLLRFELQVDWGDAAAMLVHRFHQ
ncbi:hypothetical protein HXX76_006329 [Chlamydomonas incerta]|uniref:Kinesin motor domain-containing protein n=1 Tax=Chlamydomonas incerta TaxID=51695 RepID=A0A835TEK5_CHLIN|nr:hypothetical protein HXX76_006329 [Chlamydomonas incerta]|eukprot:KAG2436806.1 hypothetical protein HXX76_006329 [Chlamydomonas incerta]